MKKILSKKLFFSVILISFIFNFIIQAVIGVFDVKADTVTVYDDKYVYTYAINFMASAPKRTGNQIIKEIDSKTMYTIRYEGTGYNIKIWDDDISTFKEGKEIAAGGFDNGTVKIKKITKVSSEKVERYGYKKKQKRWNCTVTLTGTMTSAYKADNLSYTNFDSHTVTMLYIKVSPKAVSVFTNRKRWKISTPRTVTVKNNNNSKLINEVISKFGDITKEVVEAAAQAGKAVSAGTNRGNSSSNGQSTNSTSVGNSGGNSYTSAASGTSRTNQNTSTGSTSASAKIDHSDMNDNARRLYIRNLYKRVLKREPSNNEINTHFGITTYQEAVNIIFSKESNTKNNINNMTNEQFVEACYNYLLGRSADQSGKNTWINYLSRGNTRQALVKSIIQSTEFKNNTNLNTTTLTFNDKTCDACYVTLRDNGFSVIKPTATTLTMYARDIDKVTSLNLSGKNITDLSGLSNFKNLKKLNVGKNSIGDISKISALTNLEELVINDNNIKGLKGIGKLTKLTVLNLNGNPVSDMSEISQLTNLKRLYMTNCKLHYFTANLSKLTKLEEVWLENNCLCTDGIINLAAATNLKKLYLNKNQITNLSVLAKLNQLQELYANENNICNVPNFERVLKISIKNNTGALNTTTSLVDVPSIMQEVKNTKSKLYTNEDFQFTNCKLEDGRIQVDPTAKNATIIIKGGNADGTKINITNYFRNITVNDRVLAERLKSEFNLSEINEKDGKYVLALSAGTLYAKKSLDLSTPADSTEKIKDLSGIEAINQLTSINLRNNEISNFEPLSKLEKLETLDVRFNNINDFSSLKNLKSLKQLDASNNRITDINGIENLENLRDLLLSNNDIKNNLRPLNKLKDSLSTLALINNGISDLSELSELKLSNLYLGYNEISDISSINTESLENIDLENNNITMNIKGNEATLPKMIQDDCKENGGVENLECVGCEIINDKITLNEGIRVATIKVLNGKLNDTVITVQDNDAMEAPKLSVNYQLRNNNTEMLVTINADKEIQPVLGWDRINNSTGLQKIYNYNVLNQTITVSDMFGNETNQLIEFTGVVNSRIPNLTVSYSDNMRTRSDVTVTLSSSEKLHNVERSWTLSEDGQSISKVYNENTNHAYTNVLLCTERMYNIQMQPVNVEVELSIIDKDAPECTVEYSETNTTKGSVRATIWSDEEIYPLNSFEYTKTKKIDESGKTKYGIIFYYNDNSSDMIIVRDLVHNLKIVDVTVNNIDKNVDGLYAQIDETNATKGNVKLTVGANEEIFVKDNDVIANTNKQKMLNANVKKLSYNLKNMINANNTLYEVAGTVGVSQGYLKPIMLLSEGNETGNAVQSGNRIEMDLQEKELGVIEATDATNNKDLVLFNSSMIDKDELIITREDINNDDGTVTIKLKSNRTIEKTEDLGNWSLSENGQELTQIFSNNKTEVLKITDSMGNTIDYEFSIDSFDTIDYTVYYYPVEGTDQVYVVIDSDTELEELDGWELSEDKKSLCKKMSEDNKQIITIYDVNGNEQEVIIQYDFYESYTDEEKNVDETVVKTDDTQANVIIPNAGKYTAFAVITSCILTIITFFTLRKYKKNIEN